MYANVGEPRSRIRAVSLERVTVPRSPLLPLARSISLYLVWPLPSSKEYGERGEQFTDYP